jgi:hypothetical protein
MKRVTSASLLTCLACAGSAQAATQLGEHVSFSGFGTLGYTRADTDDGRFRREFQPAGAGKSGSLKVDSNLGLQLTGKVNDWLSATVQTVTMQRATDDLSTRIDWAFVKVTPIEGLAVRAGRMSLPNFLVSDSRRVGFANTWLRPANEVYGLDYFTDGLKGLDASYRLSLGDHSLTVTALAGKSGFTSNGSTVKIDQVRGLNATWESEGYSLRIGRVEGQPMLDPSIASPIPGADLSKERYRFTGIGAMLDRNDIVLQAEYAMRRSAQVGSLVDANGWYVLGGYRMGAFLPYAQVARSAPRHGGAPARQSTKAVGLRWDAFRSAALKFQFERIDTHNTPGLSFVTAGGGGAGGGAALTEPVNVVSAALDFVF